MRKILILTSRFGRPTWRIIGAHLAGPGNEYFQLSAFADIDVNEPRVRVLALEPSGLTVVTKNQYSGIEISNWIHNRKGFINLSNVRAVS